MATHRHSGILYLVMIKWKSEVLTSKGVVDFIGSERYMMSTRITTRTKQKNLAIFYKQAIFLTLRYTKKEKNILYWRQAIPYYTNTDARGSKENMILFGTTKKYKTEAACKQTASDTPSTHGGWAAFRIRGFNTFVNGGAPRCAGNPPIMVV